MSEPTTFTRRLRQRLMAWNARAPMARRAELEDRAASLASELNTLRAEFHRSASQAGELDATRTDSFDQQFGKLSSDLTNLIGIGFVENADSHESLTRQFTDLVDLLAAENAQSHDLLAERIEAVSMWVGASVVSDDPTGVRTAARRSLHNALAWQPTWSALAPLISDPLVSVIVPTRNRRELLEGALASLGRQTYADWEAIVVNDGSTDDTSDFLDALVGQDDRIRVFGTAGHGSGAARQHGYARAAGDVFAYLDDDNVMADGWPCAVVEVLGRCPGLDAVYGGQLREVERIEPWLLLEPFDELRLLEAKLHRHRGVRPPACRGRQS